MALEYRQIRFNVPLSPSLIHNNITANDRGLIAFAHQQKVCFLNLKDGTSSEGCGGSTITGLRYVNTGKQSFLAVCSTSGTQFLAKMALR